MINEQQRKLNSGRLDYHIRFDPFGQHFRHYSIEKLPAWFSLSLRKTKTVHFSSVGDPAWEPFQQRWSSSVSLLLASKASTRPWCTPGASRRPCWGRWPAGRGPPRWPPRWRWDRTRAGAVTLFFVQINPWDGKNLGRDSVRKQVEGCLSRLQVFKNLQPYWGYIWPRNKTIRKLKCQHSKMRGRKSHQLQNRMNFCS